MSFNLISLRMFFLVGVFWLLVVPLLSKVKNSNRSIVTGFTAATGVIYLTWRFFWTVVPVTGYWVDVAWVYLVYGVEMLAFIEVCIFLLIMSKINTRTEESNRYEKTLEDGKLPSVDVFIPTYDEGIDVLEKTIFGAKHIDYPDFKVWVLDDGKRDWLKEFCGKADVGYLTRPDNSHAKAGNMNNALKCTDGELFAIFDADFIPATNFLRRTVGFFINEDDIGLVQTPQHFFNRDPIQSNLYLEKVWPDEQRLFFKAIAPCRDAWHAAFCCGSCSIIRRKAIDEIGGIPTSSITEDLLTTLSLLTVGYRTVYLDEKLSQGMSADSVKGYFIQRGRWCRGGIQCFFVPEGPLRAKGLNLLQRILFTPYGWVIQPITRFMMLIVPIAYLWLGLQPLWFTTTEDLLKFQFPMLICFALSMQWLAPKKYIPILSTSIGVFGMFRLLPVVISSLIKPFGVPFRVTPKGSGSTTGIDWYILTICGLLIVATFGGIYMNLIPEYRILSTMEFFPYALLWSCVNLVILFVCALVCFDAPRKRKEERFVINEPAEINGESVVLEDLSMGGCKIMRSSEKDDVNRGDKLELRMSDFSKLLEMEVRFVNKTHIMCEFTEMEFKLREELVVKIFTGKYDNEIHHVTHFATVLKHLFFRAFGRELK